MRAWKTGYHLLNPSPEMRSRKISNHLHKDAIIKSKVSSPFERWYLTFRDRISGDGPGRWSSNSATVSCLNDWPVYAVFTCLNFENVATHNIHSRSFDTLLVMQCNYSPFSLFLRDRSIFMTGDVIVHFIHQKFNLEEHKSASSLNVMRIFLSPIKFVSYLNYFN